MENLIDIKLNDQKFLISKIVSLMHEEISLYHKKNQIIFCFIAELLWNKFWTKCCLASQSVQQIFISAVRNPKIFFINEVHIQNQIIQITIFYQLFSAVVVSTQINLMPAYSRPFSDILSFTSSFFSSQKNSGIIVDSLRSHEENSYQHHQSTLDQIKDFSRDDDGQKQNIFSSNHENFERLPRSIFYSDPYQQKSNKKYDCFAKLNDQKSISSLTSSFAWKHICHCEQGLILAQCQKNCKLCRSNPGDSRPNKCYQNCISFKRQTSKMIQSQFPADQNFIDEGTKDSFDAKRSSAIYGPSSIKQQQLSPRKNKKPFLDENGVLTYSCNCNIKGCVDNYCGCMLNNLRCSQLCNCTGCQNCEGVRVDKMQNQKIKTKKFEQKQRSIRNLIFGSCMRMEDKSSDELDLSFVMEPFNFFSTPKVPNKQMDQE